jgi:FdhD protein
MRIVEEAKTSPVIEQVPVVRKFEGNAQEEKRLDPVIVEHLLDIVVDDRPCCTLTCSPAHLVQLVVGHLFSQGYIEGIDWIDTISFTDDNSEAFVTLVAGKTLMAGTTLMAGSTSSDGSTLKSVTHRELDGTLKDQLFAQAKALYDSADWFFQTGAAHSSSLSIDGEVKYRFADVSRHNTIDKIIGQALMDGADLAKSVLFTSGRVPLDMLLKVARCGIPVVGSRSAPTTAALVMAKKLGITLVGFVRQGRMNVYTSE